MDAELSKLSERQVLAMTLWGEARGEGIAGMVAVAGVIQNRARRPRWWGGPALASICTKPWQFSCWNRGDPNRAKMLALAPDGKDRAYRMALDIADDTINGRLHDVTRGADHYHLRGISPAWIATSPPMVAEIGRHLFYRLET